MNTLNVRMLKRALLVAPLALGMVAVALASQASLTDKQATLSTTSETTVPSQAPESTPAAHVTVNGKAVQVPAGGSASVTLPSSKTTVESSGGRTTVSTESSNDSSEANKNTGNVSVNVSSNSHEGSTWESTQIYGHSATVNGNSTSFSTTNVFSAGSSYTHVSP